MHLNFQIPVSFSYGMPVFVSTSNVPWKGNFYVSSEIKKLSYWKLKSLLLFLHVQLLISIIFILIESHFIVGAKKNKVKMYKK